MKHARGVINEGREQSVWVGIARADAEEWWRENRGATFAEFAEWVERRYLPSMLSGMGFRSGFQPTALMQESLDDVHVGLHDVLEWEQDRRERRARLGAA